jgi:hypothetical protein
MPLNYFIFLFLRGKKWGKEIQVGEENKHPQFKALLMAQPFNNGESGIQTRRKS